MFDNASIYYQLIWSEKGEIIRFSAKPFANTLVAGFDLLPFIVSSRILKGIFTHFSNEFIIELTVWQE